MKRSGLLIGCGGIGLIVLLFVMWGVSTRNNLVNLDESVQSQWAQVENVYQRRADLIPNLVRTVAGYAKYEQATLQAVVEARSRVGQVASPGAFSPNAASGAVTEDPQKFQQFQAAQDQLGGALSRLLVVVERYPDLKANAGFIGLQEELAGTENRIAVERMRYNERAQQFNSSVRRFPASIIAGMSNFKVKQYFRAQAGSDVPPTVNFDLNGTAAPVAPAAPGTTTAR